MKITDYIISLTHLYGMVHKDKFVWFENYQQVIRDLRELPQMKQTVINSFMFLPITNFITLPLSIISAYFIFRGVPGRGLFKVLFFLPSIISIVVLTMAFQFMFDPLFGPINQLLAELGIQPVGGWFGTKGTANPKYHLYIAFCAKNLSR